MTGRTMAARIGTGLLAAAALLVVGFEVADEPARAPASAEAPARPAAAAPPVAAAAPANPDFVVRRILDIPGPLKMGDHHWDESGAPADGPIVITVDLEAQVLSIFRGGYEIGAAAILYGRDDKPTPLGAFPITQKDSRHVSNLYGAPMPYMMRMTNDGISIHGSDSVAPGFATHGCVAVPVAFAKKLFAAAKLGDLVIVTKGKTLQMGEPIVRT
ncbi:MAG TPA: L,D-transpeptidase family protein [Allosphingosinicella sp.]|jgi:lipoprotein-anchoring transpeptidase ErfK/SrfK|nr:L,D-transpeptidase family protein [Allosphingosinicella sp.]